MSTAAPALPYRDRTLPTDQRIDDLLMRMTLPEIGRAHV